MFINPWVDYGTTAEQELRLIQADLGTVLSYLCKLRKDGHWDKQQKQSFKKAKHSVAATMNHVERILDTIQQEGTSSNG